MSIAAMAVPLQIFTVSAGNDRLACWDDVHESEVQDMVMHVPKDSHGFCIVDEVRIGARLSFVSSSLVTENR